MMGEKSLNIIKTGEQLVALFAKHLKGPQICIDDFEKIKVIGKGGFADKVYLARKKNTG